MKKIIQSLLLLFVISLVTGCSMYQEHQANEAKDESDAYCSSVYADHKLDPIRNKVILTEAPTLEMLSNPNKPTEEEKLAINQLEDVIKKCRIKDDAFMSTYYPAHHAIKLKYRLAADNALLWLYQGNITYGEFNTAAKRLHDEREQDFLAKNSELNQQAYQQQQANSQAWQNFANSVRENNAQNAAYQQQLLQSQQQSYQNRQQQSYQPAIQQSQPIKSTDMNCLSQCTSAGYMYGLCQSKCSY